MNAGANVEAVLDTAPLRAKLNLLRGLALQPGVILRGMRYAAELVARGVPVRYGVEPLRVEGDARVTAVVWQERGTEKRITCDSLAFGLGLRSEVRSACRPRRLPFHLRHTRSSLASGT